MADQFTIDISRWTEKVENNLDKFMLEFTQDLAEEVIKNTPVDTGFLRASWTANIGSPDTATRGRYAGAKGGGEAVNGGSALSEASTRITANLLGVKGGDTVYYTNNAGYGAYVEFGTQFQAGQGFVRNAVNKAPTLARNVARRVNK